MSVTAPPKIEVRKLSLAQLQHLAARGSQRASAELERRMTEADARRAVAESADQPGHPASAAPFDRSTAGQPVRTARPAAPRLASAASLDQMAAATASAVAGAPGMTFPGNHDDAARAALSPDAEILRLQALARQDHARQHAAGPPGLVGMALLAWGVLMLLGGLALHTRTGALYYSLFGLACAVIGWLLLRCKRAAFWLHAGCVVAALLWAWRGYAGGTFITVLTQSAPVWIPAFWLAVPQVREPLN